MQLIVEGLVQPMNFDIRAQFEKPLFRKGITSLNDLALGTKLTGKTCIMIGQKGLLYKCIQYTWHAIV